MRQGPMRRSEIAPRIERIDGADQIVVEADQILSGIGLISNVGGNTARVYNFDVARLTVSSLAEMPIWFEVPMPEMSFEVQLKALKVRIVPMERLVTAIAGSVPKPLFYDSGQEHFGFRYAKPGVLHFCLLKAVRTVSALNAMVALARGGYAQEIPVLVRTLVECTTHIEFVLDALNDEGVLRPEVDKYIRDYFADYARNSSADFKRAQVKQGLVHKHLGETLDIIAEQNALVEGRKPAETAYSNIYLTYSNYVHAKYPEVMDLHGGDPGRFHLDGMRGTPKDDENFAIIDTFIDTAAIALKLIVSKLRLHHLLESDAPLRIWFRSS